MALPKYALTSFIIAKDSLWRSCNITGLFEIKFSIKYIILKNM